MARYTTIFGSGIRSIVDATHKRSAGMVEIAHAQPKSRFCTHDIPHDPDVLFDFSLKVVFFFNLRFCYRPMSRYLGSGVKLGSCAWFRGLGVLLYHLFT